LLRLPLAKMPPAPNEKSPLLKDQPVASLEDPQLSQGATAWELRVLLIPCKIRAATATESFSLIGLLGVVHSCRLLAQDVGTGEALAMRVY